MTTWTKSKSLLNVIQRDFKGEGAREKGEGKPSRKTKNKKGKTKPKSWLYIHSEKLLSYITADS